MGPNLWRSEFCFEGGAMIEGGFTPFALIVFVILILALGLYFLRKKGGDL